MKKDHGYLQFAQIMSFRTNYTLPYIAVYIKRLFKDSFLNLVDGRPRVKPEMIINIRTTNSFGLRLPITGKCAGIRLESEAYVTGWPDTLTLKCVTRPTKAFTAFELNL